MKLRDGPGVPDGLCRWVEAATARIPELGPLTIAVDVVADLKSLPNSTAFERSPAAYDRAGRILINRASGFLEMPRAYQEAILLHEVGHAHAHQVLGRQDMGDELDVDLQVCRWGFSDLLVAHRSLERPVYASTLGRVYYLDADAAKQELLSAYQRG